MKLFNLESPVMQKVGEISDFFLINLLFVICCMPIITIGAACTALYSVSFSYVTHGSLSIRMFLRNFWENLLSGITRWLLALIPIGIFSVNLLLAVTQQFPGWYPLMILFAILLFLCLLVLPQVFLFQARFTCGYWQLFLNAFRVTGAHPVRGLAIALLLYIPLLNFMFLPSIFSSIGLVYVLFYFSLVGYFSAKWMTKIYEPYIQKLTSEESQQ